MDMPSLRPVNHTEQHKTQTEISRVIQRCKKPLIQQQTYSENWPHNKRMIFLEGFFIRFGEAFGELLAVIVLGAAESYTSELQTTKNWCGGTIKGRLFERKGAKSRADDTMGS